MILMVYITNNMVFFWYPKWLVRYLSEMVRKGLFRQPKSNSVDMWSGGAQWYIVRLERM